MITTDTTEPGAAEATEADEDRHAQRRRERHAALMDALEELTDLAADAGPDAALGGDKVRVEVNVGVWDGTPAEQATRIHRIAAVLGVDIEEHPHDGSVQFWARKQYPGGVTYLATAIAKGDDEIAQARAALAEAASADRVRVDYRLSHGGLRVRQRIVGELELLGVDVVEGDAATDAEVVVSQVGDQVRVERYDSSYTLPMPGRCASYKAYATAIAAWVKGIPVPEIPCPATCSTVMRGVYRDGSVVTVRTCSDHYGRELDGRQGAGWAMVTLDGSVPIPDGAMCGHREIAELGGAA